MTDPEYRERVNAYARKWNAANREAANRVDREWKAVNHKKNHAVRLDLVRSLKGTTCANCGKKFPPRQLHVHHRNPATKRFNLGDAPVKTYAFATIRAEAAKCDVLCD